MIIKEVKKINKILIGVAVVIVAVAGFSILSGSKTNNTAKVSVSSTPLATPTTSASPSAKMEEAVVNVTADTFNPKTLTIKAGTKVTWINKSKAAVKVSSDNHPTHLLYPFLNLGEFGVGSSVEAAFQTKGTFTYHNHLNPSQKGTVIVE